MDSLPPIPTPAAQRWREFRIQALPMLMFLLVLGCLVFMWRNFVQPAGVVGEVEAIRANVTSIQDGTLTDLTVDRFQTVTNDQPIGQVVVTDPALYEASLAAIAADLNLMKTRMDLDKARNQDNYDRLKFDLMTEKITLNLAQTRIEQAEAQFQRVSQLYQSNPTNIVSEFDLEVARRDRDALQKEIADRTQLVVQWEERLKQMEAAANVLQVTARDSTVEEDIKAQQEKLRLAEKPLVLKAPISGIVSMIYKRPGEKVVRGEPIITISAPMSDRVVGYIRQPINLVPTTNDMVLIRTRAQRRQVANGQILKVGPSLEPINPVLLSPDAKRMEVGLPILIGLPPTMRLVPGEFVDLSIQYSKR